MRAISFVCDRHFRTKTSVAFIAFITFIALSSVSAIFTIFDNGRRGTIRLSDSELVRTICSVCDSHFRTKTSVAFITFITFITFIAFIALSSVSAIFAIMNYSTCGCTIRLGNSDSVCSIIIICDADFRTESILTINTIFAVLAINTIFAVMNCRACCCPIIICDSDSVCSIFIICNGYIRIYAVIKS